MDDLQESGEHKSVKVEKSHRPSRRRGLLNQRHWGVYVARTTSFRSSTVRLSSMDTENGRSDTLRIQQNDLMVWAGLFSIGKFSKTVIRGVYASQCVSPAVYLSLVLVAWKEGCPRCVCA
jgi:hypothetical protein